MATQQARITHRLGGGLASGLGHSVRAQPEGGVALIPFLVEAKDIFYTLNDGIEKIRGTQRIGAQFGGGTDGIDSMHDYWYTASGAPKQRRIAYAGTNLYADGGDGAFSSISSTMVAGAKVHFSQFDDDLIITSTSPSDVPQVYDGSVLEALGTNTPNCQLSEVHKNRLWMAGEPNTPSRLFYSQTLPDGPRGDWDGADSGFIDIDPGDGDEIRGLVSYKDNLFVFKGPHKGSIHRIEGSSPTGQDPFARRDFLRHGLPAVAPNGFFLFNDDVGFLTADGSIHSLKATASYGDFNEASLSRPIDEFLAEHVSRKCLHRADTAVWSERGLVIIALPFDSSPVPNILVVMDHRFQPARWATWEDYDAQSIAAHVDFERGKEVGVMIGSSDGVVRRINQRDATNESADGLSYSAITARVTTPFIGYGGTMDRFTLNAVSVSSVPDGTGTVNVAWSRDGKPEQSETIPKSGDPLIGSTFIVGSSELGRRESRARHRRTETGGEFGQIQFAISNGVIDDTTTPGSGHRMNISDLEIVLSGPSESLENF